jgi:hypothetical protein
MADDVRVLREKVAYLEAQVGRMISLQISMYGAIMKLRFASYGDRDPDFRQSLEADIKEVSKGLDDIIASMPS